MAEKQRSLNAEKQLPPDENVSILFHVECLSIPSHLIRKSFISCFNILNGDENLIN